MIINRLSIVSGHWLTVIGKKYFGLLTPGFLFLYSKPAFFLAIIIYFSAYSFDQVQENIDRDLVDVTAYLPGTDYSYIVLNNVPVYLQLSLDQSYHPDGYYTFPGDQFMRDEIIRSKSIGLNGIRTHEKWRCPGNFTGPTGLAYWFWKTFPTAGENPRLIIEQLGLTA